MWKKFKNRIDFVLFHTLHMRGRVAIEAWQLRRLRTIVAHAAKNVPMYGELYGKPGDSAPDIRSFADMNNLPIVSKKMFLGRPADEYTDNSAMLVGRWATTSGTSGEPLTMLTRAHFKKNIYVDSVVYRMFYWENPWKMPTWPRIARIFTKAKPRKNRLFVTITDYLLEPENVLNRVIAFRPDIIESFASILHSMAQLVEQKHIPFQVRYVISGGEQMTPALRRYIESVLGCEVYNRYGMEEFAVVGMECEKHDGLHTSCESLFVEIVDESGLPVPDGTDGRIVVTDLYNTGMPFIRYDTGDHGTMTHSRCSCGRESPRVWLEGRYAAFLTFQNRRINHLEFDAALETFMNAIMRYLVVKKSEEEVAVLLIPGVAFGEGARSKILLNIQELVGPTVRVSVETVDDLPKTPRGKSKIVLDMSDETSARG